MTCPDEDTVLAFVDGNLGGPELASVEGHLAACATCAELVALTAESRQPTQEDPASVRRSRGLRRGENIGRYLVLDLLGRGGMGEVYTAYDPQLERKVALKLLRDDATEPSAEHHARLLREARATARLSHPNVVVVHDAGEVEGQVFLAMELVEGKTIAAWLDEKRRSWREIRDVFVAAGRGLAAAHAAGLVHRDFKPHNVMVGADGSVRVMDFGLARPTETDPTPELPPDAPGPAALSTGGRVPAHTLTRTGALVGTPAYMAPEQFLGERTDARTDQFSFCIALHEALFGERPFSSENLPALIDAVLAGKVREPTDRRRAPAWMRKVIARGLRRKPDERFPSMRELLLALDRDPARRTRRIAIAAGMVGVLAVVTLLSTTASRSGDLLCRGARDRLAGVWEPAGETGAATPRREAVRRAFVGTGSASANDTWTRVARALDAYVASWTSMYTDACEATHRRGEQSAEVLDLRMDCLGGALDSVRALTDVFASADAKVLQKAVHAASELPALSRCADVALLKARTPPPTDAHTRARLEGLRRRLADAKSLRDTGRQEEAARLGTPLLSEAQQLAYKPFTGEVALLLAHAEWDLGRSASSISFLTQAFALAEATRHEELAAESALDMAVALVTEGETPLESQRWSAIAEAIVERLGPGHDLINSWLWHTRATISQQRGDCRRAVREAEQAVASKERARGAHHQDVGGSLLVLSACAYELGDKRAVPAAERALNTWTRAFGDASPHLGMALAVFGQALVGEGRHAEALDAFRRARALWEPELGLEHARMAHVINGIGQALLGLGRPSEAVAPLERALAVRYRAEKDPLLVARTEIALAHALERSNPRRALGLARAAVERHRKLPFVHREAAEAAALVTRLGRLPGTGG